jgi:hypothetical protein
MVKLNLPFHMEIMVLAALRIWMTRNNKISRAQNPRFDSWKATYISEIVLVVHMIKMNTHKLIESGYKHNYKLLNNKYSGSSYNVSPKNN